MDEIIKDSRFSHITKDARFKKIPRNEKKVKIDKRFQSMFTDERFQLKSVVDKRGRPLVAKGSEHLERYYDLSGSDEDDSAKEDDDDKEQEDVDSNVPVDEEGGEEVQREDVIKGTKLKRKNLTPEIKAKLKDLAVDYARGEGRLMSDSSSDEESSSGEEEDEEVEHDWGELDKNCDTTDEATDRIAVCHMDWDRIVARDLMVLFNSFLPPGGLIHSVTIYPSDFGLKRMEEEERQGPTELTALSTADDQEDETLTQDQREKLREYQLKRLRYYYGVLKFDSPKTANHVYKECDGLEYESSMNRLDLRFIPDDTEFDQEPREVCSDMPDLSTYKPRLFRTTALTQVKVDLTWDETDPARQEMIAAAHEGKFDEARLDQFLAVSSSDEEEEERPEKQKQEDLDDQPVTEKGAIQKYKALLLDLEKTEETKKQDFSMEVTWDLKLEQKTAEKVKELSTTKTKEAKTPFEQFLDKKKEKKKLKKEQRTAKFKAGEDKAEDEVADAFSDDDIPSDIDMNDPYFKQEMDQIKPKKKAQKKNKKNIVSPDNEEDIQNKAELELLMMDEVNEGPKEHFSLKKIEEKEKKSNKKQKFKKRKAETPKEGEVTFKIDVQDDRFSAIFTSHLYNVDPAEAQFRPTEAMKALIAEKIRRRSSPEPEAKVPKKSEGKKMDAELSLLVKSVRRKTQDIKKKKSSY